MRFHDNLALLILGEFHHNIRHRPNILHVENKSVQKRLIYSDDLDTSCHGLLGAAVRGPVYDFYNKLS